VPKPIVASRMTQASVPGVLWKLYQLFDGRDRRRLILLLFGVVLMALVETAGIASVMPFLALVGNPEIIGENPWMAAAYDRFGFTDTKQFVTAAGIAVLAVITLSNAFTALTTWVMLRFIWMKHHRMCMRLLERYVSKPYSFYLTRNSAGLNKTLLVEVGVVTNSVLQPAMQLVARSVVALFILTLLVLIDPLLALTIGVVLGGSYGGVYILIRKKQGRLGQKRIRSNEVRFKAAGEIFGGIKEVKLLGREPGFLRRFEQGSSKFSGAGASNAVVKQLPKYALETIAFGGIVLITLYLLQVRDSMEQVLPIAGLYAFAAYRFMPAMQQIFNSLAQLRFNAPALEELHRDLLGEDPETDDHAAASWLRQPEHGGGASGRQADSQQTDELTLEREIVLRDLSFTYEGAPRPAIDGITLRIPRNSTIGLVGATGSGKTTLVDLILGLHVPTGGAILVDGVPLAPTALRAWQRKLGYVPQHIFLSDDTIRRNIAFGIEDVEIDEDSVRRATKAAHIHSFITSLPAGYDTIVGERGVRLSGGQRQRIGIARALYHDPEVVVLDEATSALDGVTEGEVMRAIDSLLGQKTVVVVAHRLTTLQKCDVIYMLHDAKVEASGTYEELLHANDRFQAMARGTGEEDPIPAGAA
jgi:ATP-binding cassette, subfamily B, bacterial PglK